MYREIQNPSTDRACVAIRIIPLLLHSFGNICESKVKVTLCQCKVSVYHKAIQTN